MVSFFIPLFVSFFLYSFPYSFVFLPLFLHSNALSDRLDWSTSKRLEKLRDNVNVSLNQFYTKNIGVIVVDPVVTYTLLQISNLSSTAFSEGTHFQQQKN
jgi:hypothetical protein